MHALRNTYGKFSRIICFLFALHIFNLSVDPRDPQPDFTPEDLSLNDIESLTEFFAEVVFGFADAFQEHDEADSEGGGAVDMFKMLYSSGNTWTLLADTTIVTTKYFIFETDNYALPVREITSPPPRA